MNAFEKILKYQIIIFWLTNWQSNKLIMEYILKVAEEVDQQWAEMQQQEENSHYKSVFTLNGKSILSPLVSDQKACGIQHTS